MIFEIKKAKNGTILKVNSGIEDNEIEEIVYQEKYDDEIECFADFLRYLEEHYGPPADRHSAKRIYINIRPGDKFEDYGVPHSK
ncbi:MAG: hypothetical protein P9L90_02455 [Candidatus Aadella gelida]|nr:hypothetical protein [Candidatus Aadella gelida]